MTYEEILTHFDVSRRYSSYAMAHCSCGQNHKNGDRHASLRITPLPSGGTSVVCLAGCSPMSVITAAGLTARDVNARGGGLVGIDSAFFGYSKNAGIRAGLTPESVRVVDVYDYADKDGNILYSKLRVEGNQKDGTRGKTMPCVHINYATGKIDNTRISGKAKAQAPLFNLPAVLAGIKEEKPIYITEGEKDALALESLGYIATTSGDSNSWNVNCKDIFKGADVVILPDNDRPGEKYKDTIIASLADVARSIRIVKTSDKTGGDVSDYLADHDPLALGQLIQAAEPINAKAQAAAGMNLPGFVPADELAGLDLGSLEWFVDRLLTRGGVSVIAAPPKSYKSFLMLDMAVAIATGADFLGYHTHKADVMYLDLESNQRRPRDRLALILGDRQKPHNLLIIANERGKRGIPRIGDPEADFFTYLEMQLTRATESGFQVKLVILDMYAKVQRLNRPPGLSAYECDYIAMAEMQDFCNRHNLTIMLVLHTTKSAVMRDDPLTAMQGSNGIPGAAENLWTIQKNRQEKDGVLFVSGKDIASRELAILWQDDKFRWRCLGDASQQKADKEQQARMEEYNNSQIPRIIAELVGRSDCEAWEGTVREIIQASEILGGWPITENDKQVGTFLNRNADLLLNAEDIQATPPKYTTKGKGRVWKFCRKKPDESQKV